MNKDLFEEARKAWHENGGVVNGYDPEYDNLIKVCKQYKLKISEVIPLLLPAVNAYFAYCEQRKANNVFCESPSSFMVFTNNRRWLREYPASRHKADPKKREQGWRAEQRADADRNQWILKATEDTLRAWLGHNPHLVWLVKELRPELTGKDRRKD